MKSAPSPPPAPDPTVVAQAQTGSNVTTGIANSIMGNANIISPQGTSTSAISGYQDVTNPTTGDVYQVPTFTQTNQLSPEQQQLYDQQTQIGSALNQLALDQTQRIGGLLGQPLDFSSLPARSELPTSGPALMGGGGFDQAISMNTPLQMAIHGVNRPAIQGSVPMQNQSGQIGDAGGIARLGGLYNQSGQIGYSGDVSTDVNMLNQSGQIGYAGPINKNVGLMGQSMGFGGTSTGVQTNVGPQDWSADRTKVEEALYSRMNPQLARDREALESTLVNQGFQRGTPAFDEAMNQQGRQANDARMQAVIAGGAEQSRLAGLDMAQGQFANQAQQQEYGQQLGRGQFYNAAAAGNNASMLAAGQFANQAQGQQFSQNQAMQQASDAATAANNQSRLTEGQFHNTAQGQRFGQQTTAMQAANAATAANNQARVTENTVNNAAQQQQFGQNQAAMQASNAATAANNQSRLAEATFGRESQAQGVTQDMANAQLYNNAAQQNNAANLASNQFYNAAQQQGFQQNLGMQDFYNKAAQQGFGNQLQLAQAESGQRASALQEMMTQRNQPINEISALMGGGQVSMPQFQNYQAGQIAGTPVGEYYYQTDAANRANYQAQLQYESQQLSGLYGMAGAGIMGMMRFSDRRLKSDIIDLGVELINGIKLYSYKLLGGMSRTVGAMADEVFHVKPSAVYLTPSGFLAVDYGEIV